LEAVVARLETLVAQQQAQIETLTARLNQNSGNSSQPPSADPPTVRAQRPTPPPSGRKPGGQQGHRGTTRCDFPPERVDQAVDCYPGQCAACGAARAAVRGPQAPAPRVHQVGDLPPLQLQGTEYRLHTCTCLACGQRTPAPLPEGVPAGHWGPGVQALAALLTGYFRLSRRLAQEFLRTLLGHAPCLGTLIALEAATVAALTSAVQEAADEVATAEVVNTDETGWRKGRDRPTLWVVVTRRAALFRVGRRDKETYETVLPPGRRRVIGSDRYVVYDGVEAAWRQLCWAHLKRNFQALTELREGRARAVGKWAGSELRKLFHVWHQFQAGHWSRTELRARVAPIRAAFRALLALGATSTVKACRNLCSSLQDRWEGLWTFGEREGVEPTNNAAERALRTAVLWRKSSFGHKSQAGSTFVETLLTVGGSLRLQGRSVMEFVQAACRAAVIGGSGPKLLPPAA
jgi:transposase